MSDDPCDRCGQVYGIGEWPFCPHGVPLKGLTVLDDSIPGGMTIENMGPTPITFYSRSEYRRELKARGLINKVRHMPGPESDKSPHTSRWI